MPREVFLGVHTIHMLHHAAEEPVYGLAMTAELRRRGYEMSLGTRYPILHSMEAAGYLTRHDRVVNGKVRKYYAITDDGRTVLAEARDKVRELVGEVIEGRGPKRLPMEGEQ